MQNEHKLTFKRYQALGNQKDLELKKHVAMIHSSNRLTLLQRKIANALLFNAYDELLKKNEYVIHIKSLCELIGYDSHDHKTIKKALINLLSTVIEWNLVDGDKLDHEGVWNASSIIADASIDGPVCTYSYSNKMKHLLYRPEIYGRLNLLVQAKFKSSYGLALYENCIRYQDIKNTPWFDIGTFRKLMGVEEGKYLIFRDLKKRVLDKAISEVNAYSPIQVTVQYKKHSRIVEGVQFLIDHAQAVPYNIKEANTKSNGSNLAERLHNTFGFSSEEVKKVLTTYETNYILEKMAIIESSTSYKNGKIVNLTKYLEQALLKNYQEPRATVLPKKSLRSEAEVKTLETKMASYNKFQNEQIFLRYATLIKEQKEEINDEFKGYINKGLYYEIYLREGITNILVADQFCDFIKAKHSEWLNNLISFEQYTIT